MGRRQMVWPADLPSLMRAAGVPCADCLQIARAGANAVRHTFEYHPGTPEHWASGIVAHCGGTPTV